jgi:hypothetical protein
VSLKTFSFQRRPWNNLQKYPICHLLRYSSSTNYNTNSFIRPVAQELLAHAILWLDIQHPVLSDIDAMTTPLETNVDAKNLPIDLVRVFATQNKWIWITKMETGIHDFLDIDRYVIDFRETEFANTARMMYFQKGQTLYLHHLCHPARRERVRGRVPDSLFYGVADNLNLRGKLNSLVQKFRQAVRSGYDSPPHGDLFSWISLPTTKRCPKPYRKFLQELWKRMI